MDHRMIYSFSQAREKENPFLQYLAEFELESDLEEGDALFVDLEYTHTREYRLYKIFKKKNKLAFITHHASIHSRARYVYWRRTTRGVQMYHHSERLATYYYIKREDLPAVVARFWPGASPDDQKECFVIEECRT